MHELRQFAADLLVDTAQSSYLRPDLGVLYPETMNPLVGSRFGRRHVGDPAASLSSLELNYFPAFGQ